MFAKILKENWIFIVISVVICMLLFFFFNRTEKYYDYEITGCSTCSAGDAGVLIDTEHDFEIAGCSTCNTGDAGVLIDTETENDEIYNMPDEYYETPMEIADTIAEVSHNPSEIDAVVEDREEMKIIDPTDYANQTDEQLVNDFYGDGEIDYKERERIHKIRFMPIDFLENDGAFTLLN